jgi:hypothetical protein
MFGALRALLVGVKADWDGSSGCCRFHLLPVNSANLLCAFARIRQKSPLGKGRLDLGNDPVNHILFSRETRLFLV